MNPQPVVIHGVPCTLRSNNGGGSVDLQRHQPEGRGAYAAAEPVTGRGQGR